MRRRAERPQLRLHPLLDGGPRHRRRRVEALLELGDVVGEGVGDDATNWPSLTYVAELLAQRRLA